MKSKVYRSSVAIALAALVGCSTGPSSFLTGVEVPEHWQGDVASGTGDCEAIDAVFKNLGETAHQPENGSRETRLDAALGRVVDSAYEVDSIRVDYQPQSGMVRFDYLGGRQPYSFSIEAACENGRLAWHESKEEQYLADGTWMDKYNSRIELLTGRDSDLLIYTQVEVRFSNLLWFSKTETTGQWSRFEQIRE